MCGQPRELVSKQFNSPLNLYSDAAIADAAAAAAAGGKILNAVDALTAFVQQEF